MSVPLPNQIRVRVRVRVRVPLPNPAQLIRGETHVAVPSVVTACAPILNLDSDS